jgi:hypothetical protein
MSAIGEPDNSLNSQLTTFPKLEDTALHGLAGDIVRAIIPQSEADPAALLLQTLAFFGNYIGRTAYIVTEDDKQHTNLFVLLVGDTSKSRKGTSLGRVKRVFQHLDESWLTTRIMSGLSSGEGLISAVRNPAQDQFSGIKDEGASDKRLLVIESEFAAVLAVMSRTGNILSSIIREAWDTGTLNIMTKTNPLHATNAHISIIGHITREELNRRLTAIDTSNGFANRFLFAATRRSQILPEGGKLDDDTCLELAERLKRAAEFSHSVGEMKRDEDARMLWAEMYKELSTGHTGLFGTVTSRAEAQVLRLACLYALLDCSKVIRREHLEAAYALWQYCEASAGYIFGQLSGNQIADHVLTTLRQVGDAGLTQTEISNLFSGHKRSNEISTAMAVLSSRGLVTSQNESTGGRPTVRWFAVEAAKKAQKAEEPN